MRVLITTDTVGGVWTFTRELVAGLLEEGGHVCCVSFGRQPSVAQCAAAAALQARFGPRIQFHAAKAPLEWMDNNSDAYTAGAGLLLQLITAWAPDVLHLNQFCYGALACSLPKLVTIHSDVLSWAAACGESASLPAPWLSRYNDLVRRGIEGATLLTAPTEWMLNAFLASFPCDCPSEVIANGITPQQPADAPPRTMQAVTAGRFWDKGKGLQLIGQLQSPWSVVVAGERPAACDTLNRIAFAGVLAEPALYHLFRRSAVYLCCSLYEPFGLAPLEAALCGCAVVARDLPSLREVWGDAALYFTNASGLEAALADLQKQPKFLEVAQQRAGARARTYTRQRMTQDYQTAYSRALELHNA